MDHSLSRLLIPLVVGLLALPAYATKYSFSKIQYPTSSAILNAVGPSGHVAVNFTGQKSGAFLWLADGTSQPLDILEGFNSRQVLDANASGVSVGAHHGRRNGERYHRATIWHGSTPSLLPMLGGTLGDLRESAIAINNRGVAVGYSITGGQGAHAVLWDSEGAHDLGTGGGVAATAWGINSSARAVGTARLENGDMRGVVWTNGVAQQVGTAGGSSSFLSDINDQGWAVGDSLLAGDDILSAVLWDGQTLRSLGSPTGGWSFATDIGNDGTVYGQTVLGEVSHAAVWIDGKGFDLHDLVINRADLGQLIMTSAIGADEDGRIYGYLNNPSPDGSTHQSFVLTPIVEAAVPEPAPFLIILTGLGLFALRRFQLAPK